ncbi:MAG: kynureninase [Chitinophagaceae bacterium]
MIFENTLSFAQQADQNDVLRNFRNEFYIPSHNGHEAMYFTGNSLGLQPKAAEAALRTELEDWKNLGVEGHFQGKNPWFHYHKFLTENAAKIVGAKPLEVVVMNQLTSNLHFLFVSFYRPDAKRFKIIMEVGAFPSDMYLVESQVRYHGFNPDEAIIEVKPRDGEHALRHEDIIATIDEHKDSVALVFFSGVQYYTGQVFNIEAITKKAHEVGAVAGFDLAHAAGNIDLQLHQWQVDFAAWCSYKYLNSGPGSVGGVFVHENHAYNKELPRFAGWWGHNENERFKMLKGFDAEAGAAGWQLSNAPVLSMAVHKVSLDIFEKAGMSKLVEKGKQLNAYLNFVINEAITANPSLELNIITPPAPERGCQISVLTGENGKQLFDFLTQNGVIADWRNPNVIRMAPVPLYNSFEDIYRFGQILQSFK